MTGGCLGSFTQHITENLLCKAFRILSNKEEFQWCDTLSLSQLLCKFEPGSVVIIYPSTDKQEAIDGDAVINQFRMAID
jgi:hypothetical protein